MSPNPFQPLPPVRKLSEQLVQRLTAEITHGRFQPGDRLPTEQEMVEQMAVSRTVIREAVSALRALGLVEIRHGVGAFVAKDPRRRPFQLDPESLRLLPEVLHVLELRSSVEVEAAGLAAKRRSAADLKALVGAIGEIADAIARGEDAVEADFAFHCAIADATQNPYFRRFLSSLGTGVIPRQAMKLNRHSPKDRTQYLLRSQAEHEAIFDAIERRDHRRARRAMQRHLQRGRERYRRAGEVLEADRSVGDR